MNFLKLTLLIIFNVVGMNHTWARPLTYLPINSTEKVKIKSEFQSDAWVKAKSHKDSPVRVLLGEAKIPLYYNEEIQIFFDFSNEHLSLGKSEVELAGKSIYFDSALLSQRIGFLGQYNIHDGSKVLLSTSYMSDSDQPFKASRDKWLAAGILYTFAPKQRHQWFAAVDYTRNRGLLNNSLFPYFGVIYTPTNDWFMVLAFPYILITHGSVDDVIYRFNASPFGGFVEAETKTKNNYFLKLGTSMSLNSYLFSERSNDNDRLYFQEVNISGTVRKAVSTNTDVTYGAGYAFERRLYEADNLYDNENKMTRLPDDFFFKAGLEFTL